MKRVLSKFLFFCVVGGLSFLIDIFFVNVFFFLKFPFPIARTLSISLALVFNFFINRNFTFQATDKHTKKQIIPYVIVYIIANLVNLGSSTLIVYLAGEDVISINVASFIGTALSIPVSFLGSYLWVFKKK